MVGFQDCESARIFHPTQLHSPMELVASAAAASAAVAMATAAAEEEVLDAVDPTTMTGSLISAAEATRARSELFLSLRSIRAKNGTKTSRKLNLQ